MNAGLSKKELQDFIKVIEGEVSMDQAQLSKLTLDRVLENKK